MGEVVAKKEKEDEPFTTPVQNLEEMKQLLQLLDYADRVYDPAML